MRYFNFLISSLIIFSSSLISCTNTSDIDINDFNVLVQTWNKAHSSKDVGVFSNLYDDKVLYYGDSLSKNVCIESKLSFFKKYPDFYQQIFGGIQIDTISSTEYKISFVKRVTINKISSDYPSYLTFKKIDANWKITTEGDLVTDKNLDKKVNLNNNKPILQDYDYNKITTIDGILYREVIYGPPNYGETPETDIKYIGYVLKLDKPINVISNTPDVVSKEGSRQRSYRNVSRIQLEERKIRIILKEYDGLHIRVSGYLMEAYNGYHATDVLIDVSHIDPLVVMDGEI